MTAPLPRFGACCASGNVRRDPWTGDERCQHCGLPVPLPNAAAVALHGEESPPPVLADDRDPAEGAAVLGFTLRGFLILLGFALAFAAGVWAAGGGR